jgi:hypothetical protein
MIQRKQSVFLFLAIVFLSGLAFLPLATFLGDKNSLVLYVYQLVSMVPDLPPPFESIFLLPLLSLVVIPGFLIFVTIFMFKNRKRQMMMIRLSIFLLVVEIGLFFLYYVNSLEEATGGLITPELGIYLIPVALLFLFLALRGVIADERLIRSSERLR